MSVCVEDLPEVVLECIFSQLDTPALVSASEVCSSWNNLANDWVQWRRLCRQDWGLDGLERQAWRSSYCELYLKFSRYRGWAYREANELWDVLLRLHHRDDVHEGRPAPPQGEPEHAVVLLPGLTCEELDELESAHFPLDPVTRCFYSIHSGQAAYSASGLLGRFSRYPNDVRDLFLLPPGQFPPEMAACPAGVCLPLPIMCDLRRAGAEGFLFSAPTFLLPDGAVGTLFEHTLWQNAPTFSAFIRDMAVKHGVTFHKNPTIEDLAASGHEVVVTKHVHIQAHPFFVYEDVPLFGYRVFIYMPDDAPQSAICQLKSRHWEIRQEGEEDEVVNGPGVVGMFPLVHPGGMTFYQSFCPLAPDSTQATMSGWFRMVRQDGSEFDAGVPTMRMAVPTPLPYRIDHRPHACAFQLRADGTTAQSRLQHLLWGH
mmetsp:Transcript_17474/g.44514  ORF Transcript_17474/g.44514 Transcript_17474/m.44514 type:complete len:428 (+) Transcript_17474:269-1552(+)|eukprot:CAMPEP_0177679860 /NCGR_PEP_ID=MMETSP0447-20121125/29846_1 /TAXON_ID=0 /ORGANISM="Stygamoeba regulata, Strain BSH-02190019" /LENGTH=427 /DNA_ID=CAMNT_0019189115 /DNA_START=193 /DNA_END=1476 /DNA_ORIENTATION=-